MVRNRALHSGWCGRCPWLALLLLVALTTRALVPVGYMPGPGGVMLCPAYAPVPTTALNSSDKPSDSGADRPDMEMSGMDMPMAGMDMPVHSGHGKKPSQHDGAPCPFSAAASTVAITHTPLLLARFHGSSISPQPFIEQSVPRSTTPLTRLPRGPPIVT